VPLRYGNLISQRRAGATSFYLFDGVGSTTQLANSTGSVTDSYLYDSFGNTLVASGTTVNPFRYVGHCTFPERSASCDPPHQALNEPADFGPQAGQRRE
jgi:hypothetical protein